MCSAKCKLWSIINWSEKLEKKTDIMTLFSVNMYFEVSKVFRKRV